MRLIRGYCNFQSTEYAAVRLLDTLIDEQLRDGDYFCIQDVKCSHDVQIVSLNMEQLVSNKYTHGKVNHIGDRHGVILAHKDHSQWIQQLSTGYSWKICHFSTRSASKADATITGILS